MMKIKFTSIDKNGKNTIKIQAETWRIIAEQFYLFLIASGYGLSKEDLGHHFLSEAEDIEASIYDDGTEMGCPSCGDFDPFPNQILRNELPKAYVGHSKIPQKFETDPFLNEKRTNVNPNLNMSSTTSNKGVGYID